MDYDGLSGWEKYDIFSHLNAITLACLTDVQRTTGSTTESSVIEAETI